MEFTKLKGVVAFAAPGATIALNNIDGEVVTQFPLPVGRTDLSSYDDMLSEGEAVTFDGPVRIVARPRAGVLDPQGARKFETGANPDFRPSSTADQEIQALKMAFKRLSKEQAQFRSSRTTDPLVEDVVESTDPVTPTDSDPAASPPPVSDPPQET